MCSIRKVIVMSNPYIVCSTSHQPIEQLDISDKLIAMLTDDIEITHILETIDQSISMFDTIFDSLDELQTLANHISTEGISKSLMLFIDPEQHLATKYNFPSLEDLANEDLSDKNITVAVEVISAKLKTISNALVKFLKSLVEGFVKLFDKITSSFTDNETLLRKYYKRFVSVGIDTDKLDNKTVTLPNRKVLEAATTKVVELSKKVYSVDITTPLSKYLDEPIKLREAYTEILNGFNIDSLSDKDLKTETGSLKKLGYNADTIRSVTNHGAGSAKQVSAGNDVIKYYKKAVSEIERNFNKANMSDKDTATLQQSVSELRTFVSAHRQGIIRILNYSNRCQKYALSVCVAMNSCVGGKPKH